MRPAYFAPFVLTYVSNIYRRPLPLIAFVLVVVVMVVVGGVMMVMMMVVVVVMMIAVVLVGEGRE